MREGPDMYTRTHTNTDTRTHRGEQTDTHVNQGGFYTQWKMKKGLDDITLDRPAVTDSNSEVRRHINLNHLTYCSEWVGGWKINGKKVTERERLDREHKFVKSANALRQFHMRSKQDISV